MCFVFLEAVRGGSGTREVAQIFLTKRWGEFGYPMVLSAGCGRPGHGGSVDLWRRCWGDLHGSHFGDAEVDEDAGDDGDGEAPEEAAGPSIGESEEEVAGMPDLLAAVEDGGMGKWLTRR